MSPCAMGNHRIRSERKTDRKINQYPLFSIVENISRRDRGQTCGCACDCAECGRRAAKCQATSETDHLMEVASDRDSDPLAAKIPLVRLANIIRRRWLDTGPILVERLQGRPRRMHGHDSCEATFWHRTNPY